MALPQLATREEIQSYLTGVAAEVGVALEDPRVAEELDKRDELAAFRKKFALPTIGQMLEEEQRDASKCCPPIRTILLLKIAHCMPHSGRGSFRLTCHTLHTETEGK